ERYAGRSGPRLGEITGPHPRGALPVGELAAARIEGVDLDRVVVIGAERRQEGADAVHDDPALSHDIAGRHDTATGIHRTLPTDEDHLAAAQSMRERRRQCG